MFHWTSCSVDNNNSYNCRSVHAQGCVSEFNSSEKRDSTAVLHDYVQLQDLFPWSWGHEVLVPGTVLVVWKCCSLGLKEFEDAADVVRYELVSCKHPMCQQYCLSHFSETWDSCQLSKQKVLAVAPAGTCTCTTHDACCKGAAKSVCRSTK